jgi:hypothetical protein
MVRVTASNIASQTKISSLYITSFIYLYNPSFTIFYIADMQRTNDKKYGRKQVNTRGTKVP